MTEPTLGEILGEIFAERVTSCAMDLWGQRESAKRLAREVATASGQDATSILDRLYYVPDNLLALLHSPQGWTALCAYVAADLGFAEPDYRPTIH